MQCWLECLLAANYHQGRNHGWKVEGYQGLGPNTGALAPHAGLKAGLGVGCRKGHPPPPLWGSGVSPPENFWNSRCQILHSGDYLLWNFLLFENYDQEVGDLYIVGPQPKSWGNQSPRSLRLLHLWLPRVEFTQYWLVECRHWLTDLQFCCVCTAQLCQCDAMKTGINDNS